MQSPTPDLTHERCVPCVGGVTHLLTRNDLELLLPAMPSGWNVSADAKALERELTFKNFRRAMGFLTRVAELAEAEGHHPDFCLYGWNHVRLSLTTHMLGGLSRNDLILAAKIEQLL